MGLAAFCRVSRVRLHTPVPTGAVRRPVTGGRFASCGEADFRQSALSTSLACSKFRTATATLGHEIASGGDNGFNSSQRVDFRAYGGAVTQLGELVGRSGANAGLVRDFELTGAASAVVAMAPEPSAEEVAALSEDEKLYPLERKA